MSKVVAIGGGTGSTAVLQGLKKYSDISLSVIVSTMDDGGSNAVVRDDFGLLPLSDLRKSIVALSGDNEDEILRQLFTYRFSKGNGLSGHTLGNLIMVALSEITGSEVEAIKQSSKIFDVVGDIIPVTLGDTRLVAEYEDGTTVVGEHNIDEPKEDKKIIKLSLKKTVKAYSKAIQAIIDADYIIVGPGDIYTSILPNIIVPGISKALQETKAEIIFISNLMSKKGETRGRSHCEIVKIYEQYAKRKVDYVLVNNQILSKEILKRYKKDGEAPINDDLKDDCGYKIVRTDLVGTSEVIKQKGDTIKRSFIRHDSEKLGNELYAIMRKDFFRSMSAFMRGWL